MDLSLAAPDSRKDELASKGAGWLAPKARNGAQPHNVAVGSSADICSAIALVRYGPILLKKSKDERRRKTIDMTSKSKID
jgi:hypothetical protein